MKNRLFIRVLSIVIVLVLGLGGCSSSKKDGDKSGKSEKIADTANESAIKANGKDIIKVGPDEQFTSMQSAWDAALPGSVILVDGRAPYSDYDANLLLQGKDNITIKGVNGRPKMEVAAGAENLVQQKGIWVLNANNITIENIEFTGASNPESKNGSGIRIEPVLNPTIRNCYFYNNDDGILAAAQSESTITIEGSEFGYNGFGDGYSHNLYIGEVNKLIFRYNYSHHVQDGHLLKTRALNNYIEYNRLTDEDVDKGYSSGAAIDMPQGGNCYVIGNIMHQGNANNSRFVWYGLEEKVNPGKNLYFVNNTLVNDVKDMKGSGFLNVRTDMELNVVIINNIFTGNGDIILDNDRNSLSWKYVDENNIKNKDPGFVNKGKYNYHLLKTADAAIDKGKDPGEAQGYNLAPQKEYKHKCGYGDRKVEGKSIDIGAYEY